MLKDNLVQVQQRVKEAAHRAGVDPSTITLIAVSKTKPASMVEELYQEGIRDFGENKVQEIQNKSLILPEDIRWHMIGHLQRNKVKQVIHKACLIHSVDSIRLACQISEEAVKKGIISDILLEVNIANEDTKFGFKEDDTLESLLTISKLPNILVKGLMTSAPYVEDAQENRVHFAKLRQLCVDLKAKNIDNTDMSFLSMGMTNDFEVAIEEGATHVRVGTAIFGERDYTI